MTTLQSSSSLVIQTWDFIWEQSRQLSKTGVALEEQVVFLHNRYDFHRPSNFMHKGICCMVVSRDDFREVLGAQHEVIEHLKKQVAHNFLECVVLLRGVNNWIFTRIEVVENVPQPIDTMVN